MKNTLNRKCPTCPFPNGCSWCDDLDNERREYVPPLFRCTCGEVIRDTQVYCPECKKLTINATLLPTVQTEWLRLKSPKFLQ